MREVTALMKYLGYAGGGKKFLAKHLARMNGFARTHVAPQG
jgi:hypothetical protein